MRLSNIFLSAMLTASLPALAAAQQKLDAAQLWIARTLYATPTGQSLTLDQAEKRLLARFKAMNGIPRYVDVADFQIDQANMLPRQRAQAIARYLEKDLDNDGTVATDELRTVLEPQSRMMLRSGTGIQIAPTPEQSEQIMQQLLETNLRADTNGDGTIDFEEMRLAAVVSPNVRVIDMRRIDPMIVKLLDTSGDNKIGEDEFLDAVRKMLATIDTNKDGKISGDEAAPYRPQPRNTF
jgi:Ca2+-binding EF-hand superfamily protein